MKIDSPNALGISTGFGIPTGGTANQVLSKVNSTNFNTQWTTLVNQEWITGGTITIGAVTTSPTKGTIVQDNVRYRQINATTYEVEYKYAQSTAGSAGVGTYIFSLPSGISFGSSVLQSTSTSISVLQNNAIPAIATQSWPTSIRPLLVVPRTSNTFQMITLNGTFNSGIVSSANGDWLAGTSYYLRFYVDIN